MKVFKGLAAFAAAMLLLTAGCRTASQDTETVKVGVVLPVSGKFANGGRKVLAGMQLAAEQINLKGGVNGKKLSLVIIDNKSDAAASGKAFEDLAKVSGITMILGAYSTNCTLAMKPYAYRLKIPLVTPTATNNVITERNPYVFRTCFRDSYQAAAMALFAYEAGLVTRIGVLMDMNEHGTYSRDLGRKFGCYFELFGGKVLKRAGFYGGQQDFKEQLETMMKAKVKGLFAACYEKDAARLVRQARIMQFSSPIFGSDGWDKRYFYENCGDKPGKCYFSSMFSKDLRNPRTKAFVRAIEKQTGRAPGSCEAQGYDAVNIAARAIESTAPGKDIRSGLYKIQNFPGVAGSISIDAQRDAQRDIIVKTVIKGKDGTFRPKLVRVITAEQIKRAIIR
ncbi:ABC transporter substrate-binding protein [Lentisphaerota bacterium ZTH]|nr:ABC transporter substrate-binding protein [Lentisphaerota bacterium]WET05993.1 ABC transporter substrate-binding protein [Lentisphaerota bacterium ZTH]